MELMHKSICYWLTSAYRQHEPEIAQDENGVVLDSSAGFDRYTFNDVVDHNPRLAQDAIPAAELQKAIRKLTRRWRRNFNEAAPALAKWFATAAWKRSDKVLQKILKDAGISVKFKLSDAQRNILHATVNQNVALIKSIPTQYLTQVEGLVMRSVQTGRNLSTLTAQLEKNFGVTHKRAAFIARDQNNKATSALTRARQIELGINKAIWMHSHAGKVPRPTHVAMDGKKYDVKKGMYDKAEKAWVHPGELINCRCFSRSIVKGFSI
jgi:SPP1 gp7 family putative phage head morphogenesis protein